MTTVHQKIGGAEYARVLLQVSEKLQHLFFNPKTKEYKVFEGQKSDKLVDKGFKPLSLKKITLLGFQFKKDLLNAPEILLDIAKCIEIMAVKKEKKSKCISNLTQKIINFISRHGFNTDAQLARKLSAQLFKGMPPAKEPKKEPQKSVTPTSVPPDINVITASPRPLPSAAALQNKSPTKFHGDSDWIRYRKHEAPREVVVIDERIVSPEKLRENADVQNLLLRKTLPGDETEAKNLKYQKSTFDDFMKKYRADPHGRLTVFALCHLLNGEVDFTIKELAKKEEQEHFLSPIFLLDCLEGFEQGEGISEFSLKAPGILGVLTLLSEMKKETLSKEEQEKFPLPTHSRVFHAFTDTVLSSPKFRESLCGKTKNILSWLLEDKDNYKLYHFARIAKLFMDNELVSDGGKSDSVIFQDIFQDFKTKPGLIQEFLQDGLISETRMYVMMWALESEFHGASSVHQTYVSEAFAEWSALLVTPSQDIPLQQPLNIFIYQYLTTTGRTASQALDDLKSENEEQFKTKISYHLLNSLVKRKDEYSKAFLNHPRVVRTFLNLLEGSKYLKPEMQNEVERLLKELFSQNENSTDLVKYMVRFYARRWFERNALDSLQSSLNKLLLDHIVNTPNVLAWCSNLSCNAYNERMRDYLVNVKVLRARSPAPNVNVTGLSPSRTTSRSPSPQAT